MKQVKKVVIYYTDGTYQEVDANIPAPVIPSGPVPRGPFKETPVIPLTPFSPGDIGKWPVPPYPQPSIVD